MRAKIILLALLIGYFALTNCNIDYYKVLELSRDCTEQDVKRAFRRLSVKYHPDKNPGDEEAAQKYLEVNKAHEVLSSPERRQLYDLYGEEGLNRPSDMDMYGNRKTQRGPNYKADISVSMADLYNGADREFNYARKIICSTCRGTGSKDGKLKACHYCNGQGTRLQSMSMGIGFNVQMNVPCDKCGGKGKVTVGNCGSCRGNKVVPDKLNLKIKIEPGMEDGRQIVFERQADQSPEFLPGDVVFILKQQSHPYFKRIGSNLYTELKISLKDAILGFRRKIKHLDDHDADIDCRDDITQPFSVKVIREEGMPIHGFPSQKGDLHTRLVVNLPKKLTDIDRGILKKIFDLGRSENSDGSEGHEASE